MVFGERSRPGGTLVAHRPGQVLPVLRAVDAAAARGWWAVGFLAYEASGGLDPTLVTRPSAPGEAFDKLPLAWFALFGRPKSARPPEPAAVLPGCYTVTPWVADTTADDYTRKLEAVRSQIAEGNTYQCNLTVRLRSRAEGDLLGLYRDLALAQDGAYNAYLDTGRFVVASASPELFFDWTDDQLTARPMKGTAGRGRWLEEDDAKAEVLRGSPKERAENLMIVDLLRNDLGKLAEWGSVEVPALFELERYKTLWQLTSSVTARPRPRTTLIDVFRALFPCGSVTGAPKRRTMALIADLEESRRGVYCGAIGMVAPPGASFRARFNVAIRTVVVDRTTGEAVYGTGGGITWDSAAAPEHAEVRLKAAILDAPPSGVSLVETMGFWPREGLRNKERHLARLSASAAYFGFRLDMDDVRRSLGEALTDVGVPRRVRLVVSPSGLPTVQLSPMPPRPEHVVTVAVDRQPVDPDEVWLYHKTTRRSTYELRAARNPHADDVILVNKRGEPTETTVANLAVRLDGKWWTPPVETGCLPGIERARLVEQGRLVERTITVAELYVADAVALVSSLRGWRAATLHHEPHRAASRDLS